MNSILSKASKVKELPILKHLSPQAKVELNDGDLQGFLASQTLALQAAHEIAKLIQEGWTERQTADLFNTYVADHGVSRFFHKAFVWFGERTRFDGVKKNTDYLPSSRVIRDGEIYILDIAPIYKGYISDIGYTDSLGPNADLTAAQKFLTEIRHDIIKFFESEKDGAAVWKKVDEKILAAGYDNIHSKYPFSVLGHRVHRIEPNGLPLSFINFGWQSYWAFLSRGLFGQLLNSHFSGEILGLWAIEPHIGGKGFGAKFEEILVVEKDHIWWLADGR